MFVAFLVISFAHGVRKSTFTGFGVTIQTVNQAMLFAAQAAVVALFGLNPLHFFWMIPLAFILGTMSLVFPLSLLSILGTFYGRLCCIGLDRDVIERNKERLDYARGLLEAGHSRDEAVRMSREKYPGTRR
jgi:hypothetical protein